MSKEKILDEYRKKFGLCDGSLKYCGCKKELDFISKAIDQTREETMMIIKKDLIKIADAGEYEDLRREVEYYFK